MSRKLILIVALTTVGRLATAQGTIQTSIKTVDGMTIQGRVSGKVAFDMGFGTGGVLVAGEDIVRIDESGVQIKAGATVLSTILSLMNRYTMMKKPPYALILENVVAKTSETPGSESVSFQAPCASFADSTCDNINIEVGIIAGNQTAPTLAVERILGEFRTRGGKGTIVPTLTITGSDGKSKFVKVGSIVPLPKPN